MGTQQKVPVCDSYHRFGRGRILALACLNGGVTPMRLLMNVFFAIGLLGMAANLAHATLTYSAQSVPAAQQKF
jgi:hypothetical protein